VLGQVPHLGRRAEVSLVHDYARLARVRTEERLERVERARRREDADAPVQEFRRLGQAAWTTSMYGCHAA
jgi:hypothetical protein